MKISALRLFNVKRFAGRGVPRDKAEAAALLDKAAMLGHVAAAHNLALLYLAFILEDGLPIVERVNGEGTFVDPRSQLAKSLKALPKAKVLEWSPEEVLSGQRDKIRKALQPLMP